MAGVSERAGDLRAFLALEAPFLLPDVRPELDGPEQERHLLQRLRERCAADDTTPLWPGTTPAGSAREFTDEVATLIRGFFRRRELHASITDDQRRQLHRALRLTRTVDEHLKRAFDEKSITWRHHPSPQKGFRSTGQEAIVGAALPLRRPPDHAPGPDYDGDVVAPLIRDLGVLLMFMPDPLHPILVQYGKKGTPMDGRDLHVGDLDHGVLPPAAPLAIATQTLIGLAYAWKLDGRDRVALSFIGDGGASLGEWHEAVNFASALRLAVVFVVQNNRWALGTHVSEQTATRRFALKGPGYGIPGITLFGNDPERIAAAVGWAAERARAGEGPTLLELATYRRCGHAHHDDERFHGAGAFPGYELEDERRAWEALDPIELYEARLESSGVMRRDEMDDVTREIEAEVARAADEAAAAAWPRPEDYRERVFAASVSDPGEGSGTDESNQPTSSEAGDERRTMSYDEAVRDAMRELMATDRDVFVLGEDVGGRYGGAFGVTRGLAKEFGDERCLNTPLAESAIVGCAVGAALAGKRPIAEMQFADFLAPGFNALVNNAAKLHWRWGRSVPIVVRLPYGGSTGTEEVLLGGGPFHSQCPEMWFVRTPGWKIVAPATPRDARGLLVAAVRDPNPVLYLEAKGLYGFFREDLREEVPTGLGVDAETRIGSATVRRRGSELSVLTYGAMVWTALAAAERLASEGIDVEVVDLRTLVPLDVATVATSVRKTNRVLLLHEDSRRGGFGGELAALLADQLFYFLDAPIRRLGAPDTPVPYSPPLEHDYLPGTNDVVRAARALLSE